MDDWIQILVGSSDDFVYVFSALLKHSIKHLSLVCWVALAEQHSVENHRVRVNLAR